MDSNCLAAMVFDGGYSVTTSRTVSFEIVVSCMSGCGKSSPNYCGKIQIFRVASSIKSKQETSSKYSIVCIVLLYLLYEDCQSKKRIPQFINAISNMSLNFVSTSVLSSTDGVSHDTETQLQPSSSSSLNRTQGRPLYEQLRENAEKDQEKYDEVTKAMRGTTTLDDEDVAFIQGVEDRKAEIKNTVRRKEEEEIQMFRAARLEKTMMTSEVVVVDENELNEEAAQIANNQVNSEITSQGPSSLMNVKPKFIKKRRRKMPQLDDGNSAGIKDGNEQKRIKESDDKDRDSGSGGKSEQSGSADKHDAKDAKNDNDVSALGGLLAYGSDSDSD